MQLSLNFLTPPRPATPFERLEPEKRAEFVQALARIISKAAGRRAADDRGGRADNINGGNPP